MACWGEGGLSVIHLTGPSCPNSDAFSHYSLSEELGQDKTATKLLQKETM